MRRATKAPSKKRLKRSYGKPIAGEWIQPIRKGYRLACCDCGLIHLMNFRVKGRRVQFAVWRDNRATAAMRREKNKKDSANAK